MLFFRYHAPKPSESGRPWHAKSRTGVTKVFEEHHRGWHLEITERTVGVTVRRKQYHVVMRHQESGLEHTCTGLPSLSTAQQAARRWIENVEARKGISLRRRRAENLRRRYRRSRS